MIARESGRWSDCDACHGSGEGRPVRLGGIFCYREPCPVCDGTGARAYLGDDTTDEEIRAEVARLAEIDGAAHEVSGAAREVARLNAELADRAADRAAA